MVNSVPRKSRKFKAFVQFIAVSCIAGVVTAGLAIPAVGFAAAGAESGAEFLKAVPAELEERTLAQQSKMLAADGSEIATFYWLNRKEVPLDAVSEPMRKATVAIEDRRFYEHEGVDIQGIARAAVHNLLSSSKQGGSTLTQQYVKNVLAENAHALEDDEGVAAAKEATGAAGYARKLREAKLALAVDSKYSKDEILNRYMNINNYSGSPNVYGVEAAAQRYWSIPASELNYAQAATLAGIVQNPSAYNPERFEENVVARRNTVLALMHAHGDMTDEEYKEARESSLDLHISKTPNGCAAAGNRAYFCDYVQNVMLNDSVFGETKGERKNLLQRGGLTIKTTLSPEIQEITDSKVKDRVPVGDPSGAGHAAVITEPGTGNVIAMAQNRNYSVSADVDKMHDTSYNFNVDAAQGGTNGFQVGSTWKPFVLTEFLKEGNGLNTTVNAMKREYSAGSWRYDGCEGYGANWNPNNAGDGRGSPSMTAFEATKRSVNTAYAAMGNRLNMCQVMKTAESLGLKYGNGESLDAVNKYTNIVTALAPSSILGTVEVAPLDMSLAYATFANDGSYCRANAIESITDRNGENVDIPGINCEQVIDEDIAKAVAYTLTQTFNGGTTTGLGIGVPAGAKTGTTNFESGHTWLLGFSRSLLTAVWTGSPDGSRDWRKNNRGAVRGQVFGATISGKTWQAIMREAVKLTDNKGGFEHPRGYMTAQHSERAPGDRENRRAPEEQQPPENEYEQEYEQHYPEDYGTDGN